MVKITLWGNQKPQLPITGRGVSKKQISVYIVYGCGRGVVKLIRGVAFAYGINKDFVSEACVKKFALASKANALR